MNTDEIIDLDQNSFISHLRTTIILAARKSSAADIDIAAVDKIVEVTIDFIKNILEHMCNGTRTSSFSSDDLLNGIRLHPHLIPDRNLLFSIMETFNHCQNRDLP
ncbi:unnamed protein product [Adineta ricciae]|uniref:Uncharacterized protein n=1 Tax=Adineta ricciae TaxID=249248 RepID=A0A814QUJ2_ADIRI|nr:unnamed protein product [Adineta ricciae]